MEAKYLDLEGNKLVPLHTSDRLAYKRCRRKWHWSSALGRHLTPITQSSGPLWFGTGLHFAYEDWFGHKRFDSPEDAFLAYADVFEEDIMKSKRPMDAHELTELGLNMIGHYRNWLKRREKLQTLWINDEPQVEVRFNIVIPELTEYYQSNGGEGLVVYRGTFDRIAVDDLGRYWIEDYKTAASIDTGKLETDPQITSYVWAAQQWYGVPFEGVLYTQMRKAVPVKPGRLVKGGISADKRQKTNYDLYKQALIEEYGSLDKSPTKNLELLDYLMESEDVDSDNYIRRDRVRRNAYFVNAEHEKILMEGYEMLHPDKYIYPNPTRDCSWDCNFKSVCLAKDDGSDHEVILQEDYVTKGEDDTWQDLIKWPNPEHKPLQLKGNLTKQASRL